MQSLAVTHDTEASDPPSGTSDTVVSAAQALPWHQSATVPSMRSSPTATHLLPEKQETDWSETVIPGRPRAVHVLPVQ
jgi:hypothetical protein